MTPRRQAFVNAYLANGGNGTAAAIEAGYAKGSAHVTASKLLRLAKVAAAIADAQRERAEASRIDAEWVLQRSVELHARCIGDIRPALDRRGTQMKDAAGNLLFKFDSAGAARALDLIARNVQVRAFEDTTRLEAGQSLIEAMRAGRRRVGIGTPETIDGECHELQSERAGLPAPEKGEISDE